ncbi:hypothetical protein A2T76_04345 [Pseudomonas brenneri]|nr:hypothetical protein A2T76_04345 [Pseudomonas brenneri]
MIFFQNKKAFTYLTLLFFTGHIASSVAAPYQKTVAAEQVLQYIIYHRFKVRHYKLLPNAFLCRSVH